ncbi:formimidoylglutamase [Aeromonas dhakensis]|uniref:formimidoylglutamase n=1 Tax=Aeromonas dhakensis TaxID=196024 RepID=UPI000F53F0BC|nr:formimidoylglutamase [Aeromonas dhakensis]MDX7694744.1 formimidoylglutamase [Aeromonas dhakensis]RQM87270.1 formimidoylglutamase [Aeromonas dhakensis]
MDKLNGIDMSVWQGRQDPEDGELALRWHDKVLPWQGRGEPGVVLLGFACDEGVRRNKGRVGAAGAPLAVRKLLANTAWHLGQPVYDGGDVRCEDGDLDAAHERLAERVATALEQGQFPLVLGGGHEVAFGSWSGLNRHLLQQNAGRGKVGIINFDAHFDLRMKLEQASSGTPFFQIAEQCAAQGSPFAYACLGVAETANTAALFARAEALGVWHELDEAMTPTELPALLNGLDAFIARCDHLYLTIDLDVLPAAVMPGVSAPAARGVELAVIEPLIAHIRASGKLRLADLAEYNPNLDQDNRSARVAARLVHQLTK